ncbi:tyrosine-type recombinase/integrase [Hydrogenimonas thermophila]|uniref:Integrase n=1 Tax=Hydrogenimonas thermophila TaxID=223786 RepID=A0A1I5TBV3_9BACT|nr:site-specific integrase [Hydrogenimonas thermophila]SFP80492.1 integrase [Hydrogenimonas thermophila]
MPKRNNKNIYYIYADIKFTIKNRNGYWHLDFYYNKRHRTSTELKATQENLKIIKKQIIPDIVTALGKKVDVIKDEKEWTLDEFADEFFNLKKSENREHVLKRNIGHYNKHISPHFGYRVLSTITPFEIEKWQSLLLQKYKPLTVQKFRSILFSILDKAYKNEIINKNPMEIVSAPKMQQNLEENVDPFSQKEIQKILENSYGYMKNFIKLMYASGIRPGEIVALKWEDIDFNRKVIKIYKTRLRSKKDEEVKDGDVKTFSSKREIDMLPLAQEALESQMKLTSQHTGTGYIFLNSSNKPFYSHDIIGVNFKKILKKAIIKERVLYQLRHTFASQMISKGADIVWVSKMLGHKDVSITLKIYTKFIKEDDEVRMQRIKEYGNLLKIITNK